MRKSKFNINLDTSRIEKEVKELKEFYEQAEKNKKILIDDANKYIKDIEPILRKRMITINKTQMYFNNDYRYPFEKNSSRALVRLDFENNITEMMAKKLRKILAGIRVPLPACGVTTDCIIITLYDEVSYEKRHSS